MYSDVADKFLVGVTGGFTAESTTKSAYSLYDLSAGPLARFQFTRTRLSPFIEFSHQFAQRKANERFAQFFPSDKGVFLQLTTINPGVSVGILPRLRLDVNYSVQVVFIGSRATSFAQPQAGISFLLN